MFPNYMFIYRLNESVKHWAMPRRKFQPRVVENGQIILKSIGRGPTNLSEPHHTTTSDNNTTIWQEKELLAPGWLASIVELRDLSFISSVLAFGQGRNNETFLSLFISRSNAFRIPSLSEKRFGIRIGTRGALCGQN